MMLAVVIMQPLIGLVGAKQFSTSTTQFADHLSFSRDLCALSAYLMTIQLA